MDQKPDFFSAMPSKPSFFFGLVSGVAAISVLGLLLVLSGMLPTSRAPAASAGFPLAAAPSAPSPSAPAPLPPAGDPPPVTDQDHIRGNKNAKVTLIEYSDYECPFCKRFHPTMQQALDEYKDQVRWVYRHYPLNFHANAQKEAEASECANELGGNDAFWKYSDKIFALTQSNGTGLPLTSLAPMAKELGLDETKFKNCLDSGKYAQHVADDMNAGSAAGISGTPGTFVVGADGKSQLISGAVPYESVKAAIDAALR
ncbi:thioredoxin domain-containing protein [Candidatus Uhrbacteria bacterium]|nr:thioredoxin domain-containing protein [Candidatus Uhrbacteria bacterium]